MKADLELIWNLSWSMGLQPMELSASTECPSPRVLTCRPDDNLPVWEHLQGSPQGNPGPSSPWGSQCYNHPNNLIQTPATLLQECWSLRLICMMQWHPTLFSCSTLIGCTRCAAAFYPYLGAKELGVLYSWLCENVPIHPGLGEENGCVLGKISAFQRAWKSKHIIYFYTTACHSCFCVGIIIIS